MKDLYAFIAFFIIVVLAHFVVEGTIRIIRWIRQKLQDQRGRKAVEEWMQGNPETAKALAAIWEQNAKAMIVTADQMIRGIKLMGEVVKPFTWNREDLFSKRRISTEQFEYEMQGDWSPFYVEKRIEELGILARHPDRAVSRPAQREIARLRGEQD